MNPPSEIGLTGRRGRILRLGNPGGLAPDFGPKGKADRDPLFVLDDLFPAGGRRSRREAAALGDRHRSFPVAVRAAINVGMDLDESPPLSVPEDEHRFVDDLDGNAHRDAGKEVHGILRRQANAAMGLEPVDALGSVRAVDSAALERKAQPEPSQRIVGTRRHPRSDFLAVAAHLLLDRARDLPHRIFLLREDPVGAGRGLPAARLSQRDRIPGLEAASHEVEEKALREVDEDSVRQCLRDDVAVVDVEPLPGDEPSRPRQPVARRESFRGNREPRPDAGERVAAPDGVVELVSDENGLGSQSRAREGRDGRETENWNDSRKPPHRLSGRARTAKGVPRRNWRRGKEKRESGWSGRPGSNRRPYAPKPSWRASYRILPSAIGCYRQRKKQRQHARFSAPSL